MRLVLQSMQDISGRQYPLLLRQANLTRFLEVMPPDSLQPVAAGDELERLYLTLYQVLGETLARLFHRNMGPSLAAAVLDSPWGRGLQAQALKIPVENRLEWFVREMVTAANQTWSNQTLTEDAVAWYIESSDCRVCRGIHHARAPYCVGADVTYRLVGERVLGWRVRTTEVACAAMGAPHCKHAIYK
jgi:predicted hydrocarbon binding protein